MGSACSRVEAHPIIRASTVVYQDWLVNVPLFTHRHVTVAIIPPGLGVRYPSIASSSFDVDNPLRSKFRVSETYCAKPRIQLIRYGPVIAASKCTMIYPDWKLAAVTRWP